MRVVFMGSPRFAIPSLAALLDQGTDVVSVVTVPDKPMGRGRHVGMSAIKEFALSHQLSILQPEILSDPSFVSSLRALEPELFVVVAFRILPKDVYAIPSKGAINLHASLLPKYRGAAPMNWAIMNGEKETGVTTFFLQEKVDTGSMLLQRRTAIGADETAGELAERLALIGAEAVLETVRQIESGSARAVAQTDSAATAAPKIHREDCSIPWAKGSTIVHNFVRGLSPVPCAWTTFRGKILRVYRTSLPDPPESGSVRHGRPGEALHVGKERLLVGTGGAGMVSVLEIQQEGKKRMGIGEFLRGFRVTTGDIFGSVT
jgi:methionyl-tRNA formyltransferase